jgi:uncharacterized protein (TIGR02246 family)
MKSDEQAIRELVARWLEASEAGDLATVLPLMADDVLFMVPGRAPFGKAEFAEDNKAMAGMRLKTESEIQEIQVQGGWAWMRHRLRVTLTMPGGKPRVHAGPILTVLRKNPDGAWVVARDANLLVPEEKG